MRLPLERRDLPKRWYNIVPELGTAAPTIVSPSGYPLGANDLRPTAPLGLAQQEVENQRRDVDIPGDLRALYADWRPTPLYRADQLERVLGTPARIFYKYESANGAGGFEANTAIAQAYYASLDGVKRLVTATANGEWGVALAVACLRFGIECRVFMVRESYERRAYGRLMMEILGAEVLESPSGATQVGRKRLQADSHAPGSLSLALSEAFEEATSREDTKFSIGTVMNHVLLHQTVIGQEARAQMKRADAHPDVIIGAVGGGSAFGGLAFPFYRNRRRRPKMIAVETASAPSLSKGRLAYDSMDAEGLSPLLRMYTLGRGFVPPGIHAGGMRYHGISPLVSALYRNRRIEARTHTQSEAFEAAVAFARAEGFIPSPESSYAVKAVIDEALASAADGEERTILFLLNANSNFDLQVFSEFLRGAVQDEAFPEEAVADALRALPDIR